MLVLVLDTGFFSIERFPEYLGPLPSLTALKTVEGAVTHVRDGDTIEVSGIPTRTIIRKTSKMCFEMNDMAPANTAERIAELMTELCGFSGVASLVGGEPMQGDGATIQLFDPATGKKTESYPDAGPAVIATAHDAATRAQAEWWGKTASERGRIMWRIAQLIRENAAALAELEALSAGRLIRDVSGEAVRVAEQFEYYGGWCDKLHGAVKLPFGLDQCCVAASLEADVRLTPLQSLGKDGSEQTTDAALSWCVCSFHRRYSWQVHILMLLAKNMTFGRPQPLKIFLKTNILWLKTFKKEV